MNENTPCHEVNFTLSEIAKDYLQRSLLIAENMSARGLVSCLSYSGGLTQEKDGKTLWNYSGPNFLIVGQKPQHLGTGRYYDLLGFRVWIGEIEQILLKGRTLTTLQCESPHGMELLVIENAPKNYFETIMSGGKCD